MNSFFKKLFNLINPERVMTIEDVEKFCPVDSWWKSGSSKVVRVGNIYYRDGQANISIEKPKRNFPDTTIFTMVKDDHLDPTYLNGWVRIDYKEAAKLEKAYWKTHEKELSRMSKRNKNEYNDFIKSGNIK